MIDKASFRKAQNVAIEALTSPHRDDTGIQKVQEIWHGLKESGNLTGMDALEKSLSVLGITIPGIKE